MNHHHHPPHSTALLQNAREKEKIFKTSSTSAKKDVLTSKEDTTGLCSSSICAADLPVSRKAANFFIFSQAISVDHRQGSSCEISQLGQFSTTLSSSILLPPICTSLGPPSCSPWLCTSDAPSSGFSAIHLFQDRDHDSGPAPCLLTA